MKHIALVSLCAALVIGISTFASGQAPASKSMDMDKMDKNSMQMTDKKTAGSHLGTGVVKSLDTAKGSITLAHEPIKSLNWPAMTMGFKVMDKSLLNNVKPGDKVQFTMVQSGSDYVVTSLK
jgi:Cu(I)/Ag(I) efflux system protein CusF